MVNIWKRFFLLFLFLSGLDIHNACAKKVIILGVDGLDPVLLKQFMAEGILPHFSRLAREGSFTRLQTVMAPQSPVAWATFITGMDPGGHGIFDFVHRDPATLLPEFSMTKTFPPSRTLSLGSWVFPLSNSRIVSQRQGKAFWELIGEKGIPTTVYQMPVNFPPVEVPLNHSLSGMGTPDILGTPGTFSYYTTRLPANHQKITGGKAYLVKIVDNRIQAQLHGPPNPFRKSSATPAARGNKMKQEEEPIACVADFTVDVDVERKAAKVTVGGQEFILKEKEWSDWVHVDFEAVPYLAAIRSIGRFYLKQLQPDFQLYVSPLQINPEDPAMPITHPGEWGRQLCECAGYFSTKELPEDTKAFQYGIFSGREFWDQSMLVYEERVKALRCLLRDFEDGLLFMYFGTVDQCCHMLWKYMDDQHPSHISDEFLANGIRTVYQKMDDVLQIVLESSPADASVIVMSDHGFAPFYRSFNLNTWLAGKGYIQLRDPSRLEGSTLFNNVDWSQTRAYGLGLNGLYINVKGREKYGIVQAGGEYDQLAERLEKDLLGMTDPQTGTKVVTLVVRPPRDFHGIHKSDQSDLLIGYNRGYRCSWESPLGEFSREALANNEDAWSGDHCIDARLVPGTLLTNLEITRDDPALYDLTVSVLDEFGVKPLPEMIGHDCLESKPSIRIVKQGGKQGIKGSGNP